MINTSNAVNVYRTPYNTDSRSERRIYQNRIRRQREMHKNILLFVMTFCLIVVSAVAVFGFQSRAKDDSVEASYKYYTSITVGTGDTLWSIAQEHIDATHFETTDDYISEVRAINSLQDDQISYGEHLVIPYYTNTFVE